MLKRGAGNWKWKGGTYLERGYRFILTERGHVQEHRVVMEQVLGRPLTDQERVHHKDGDKLNNDPANLELLPSQSEHGKLHAAELRRTVWGWAGLGAGCRDCGETTRPHYAKGLCTRCYQRTKWRPDRKPRQS